MIYYSVDTEPRRKFIALLALVALGMTYIPGRLFPGFSTKFGPLSALGVFGVLFFLFDRYLWRFIPGVGIPNISGVWEGRIERSTRPGKTEGGIGNVTARIVQTWTRMDVVFRGEHFLSRSEVAGLFVDTPEHIELCYAYQKRPNDAAGGGREYSNGYARLILEERKGGEALVGRYFSDAYRGGSISLVKTE